jgi:RNA polymerase sigma-70 factor (ECF subfamily)
LLLRIRDAQDREAWNTFVDVYVPLVFGHCRKQDLQPADADDVTQTVLAQVSQAMRTFEYQPDKGRFRAWLGTVVRHAIARWRKKQAREPQGRGGLADDVAEPFEAGVEDSAWNEEFNAHIFRAALARSRPHFKDKTWQAFEWVWLEDRPAAEVARDLDKDVAWVQVAKSRVLKRLRQEVLELTYDSD